MVFKMGQSGNPNGRPAALPGQQKSFSETARLLSIKGLEAINSILWDEAERGSVRLAAFQILADRGFGKLTESLDISRTSTTIDSYTKQQLIEIVAKETEKDESE